MDIQSPRFKDKSTSTSAWTAGSVPNCLLILFSPSTLFVASSSLIPPGRGTGTSVGGSTGGAAYDRFAEVAGFRAAFFVPFFARARAFGVEAVSRSAAFFLAAVGLLDLEPDLLATVFIFVTFARIDTFFFVLR